MCDAPWVPHSRCLIFGETGGGVILSALRVQNYKSVEDSNRFTVADLTCLVGKNESGKTALLRALYKLNPVVEEDAAYEAVTEYPRRHWSDYKDVHDKQPAVVITTEWILTADDMSAIAKKLGVNPLASDVVTVSKGYNNKLDWGYEANYRLLVEHYLGSANLHPDEAAQIGQPENIVALFKAARAVASPSDQLTTLLERLDSTFPKGAGHAAIVDAFEELLPVFVYFSNYERMPGEVPIDALVAKRSNLKMGDRIFLALLAMVGTTPEEIQNLRRFEPLIAELEAVSNRLTREIFTFWSQNKHLQVSFRFDMALPDDPPPLNSGQIFRTRVLNQRHGVTVGFDERSAGFVWFFSFLVWFSQVQRTYGRNGKDVILLLDEPGLSLHAKAQYDLLRYMREKLVPCHQLIYSTHSPFMVDPDSLLNVRTVEDVGTDENVEGTKVGDRVLSTDADTLFPLQAALGYDITQSLFVGKYTLLVEGPSDLLYLRWFSKELLAANRVGLDPRWTIAPAGGIDKIASFVTLFSASELHIGVLTDFHQGDKKKVRDLRESDLLKQGHVLSAEMYAGQAEADIEDIVGRDNYVALVNLAYALPAKNRLPAKKSASAPDLATEEAKTHFQTVPPGIAEYDHFTPSSFLVENAATVRPKFPDLAGALDRFEQLFKDLNALLPAS
jgi:hypothetical protein